MLTSHAFARLAPASLFAVVALLHAHQTTTANLNPWLGGGFGMFSTNHRPWPQGLSIEAEDATGKRYFVEWYASNRSRDFDARSAVCAQPDVERLSAAAALALQAQRSGNAGATRRVLDNLRNADLLDRVQLRDSVEALAATEILRAQADSTATPGLGVVHARARVWRLGFDNATARFRTEPVGAPGEAGRLP
jgi:hypothetical protein